MSIAGTSIAVFFSLLLCFFAARNTSPSPALYVVATAVLNVTRAVPELILGMILVAAVGFGALPGTLALGLHSVGMLGKFYAEAIELCDQESCCLVITTGGTGPSKRDITPSPKTLATMNLRLALTSPRSSFWSSLSWTQYWINISAKSASISRTSSNDASKIV